MAGNRKAAHLSRDLRGRECGSRGSVGGQPRRHRKSPERGTMPFLTLPAQPERGQALPTAARPAQPRTGHRSLTVRQTSVHSEHAVIIIIIIIVSFGWPRFIFTKTFPLYTFDHPPARPRGPLVSHASCADARKTPRYLC